MRNILSGVVLLLLVVAMVFGVRYVSRLPALTISEVVVSGGKTIDHDVVRQNVEVELAGEYLRLVPRRFGWTYPKNDIVTSLTGVERIHNLSVDRHGKVLHVQFDEYLPHALWCESREGVRCVFLTESGYGFAPAPVLTGGAFVRYVTLGTSVAPDMQAIDSADFALLRDLQQRLSELGWYAHTMEIDKERDVFVHMVGGGELKTTLTTTPSMTVDNLRTVLASEDFAHIAPGAFVYIDLRFGNKVFVSEFGDPTELVATSTASTTVEQ